MGSMKLGNNSLQLIDNNSMRIESYKRNYRQVSNLVVPEN